MKIIIDNKINNPKLSIITKHCTDIYPFKKL